MPLSESLTPQQADRLLQAARDSISHGLSHGRPLPIEPTRFDPSLQAVRASFVTLNIEGRLRGCIGSLQAHQPLIQDVVQHAFDAAFRDPRFTPLGTDEFPLLEIHISILTPHTPIEFSDEEDLLRQLKPNVDGLIIAHGHRRATFLPSVWESLPDPADFLGQLKLKAGITEPPLQAWRYTTESIGVEGAKG